jgi:hypothetical protein
MRRGFGPPGGGREGASEAKGRRPGLREQPMPIRGEWRGGLHLGLNVANSSFETALPN